MKISEIKKIFLHHCVINKKKKKKKSKSCVTTLWQTSTHTVGCLFLPRREQSAWRTLLTPKQSYIALSLRASASLACPKLESNFPHHIPQKLLHGAYEKGAQHHHQPSSSSSSSRRLFHGCVNVFIFLFFLSLYPLPPFHPPILREPPPPSARRERERVKQFQNILPESTFSPACARKT